MKHTKGVLDYSPEKLRAAREAAGMSPPDLAEAMGRDRQSYRPAIGRFERGTHIPSAAMLLELADALGVHPSALTTLEDPAAATFRHLREWKGLTQSGLAASLSEIGYGISDRTISKWEQGTGAMTEEAMTAVADVLAVDVGIVKRALALLHEGHGQAASDR